MVWIFKYLIGKSLFHNAAVLHYEYSIGEKPCYCDIVRYQDDCDGQPSHECADKIE